MVVDEKNRESGAHVAGRKVIEKQGERERFLKGVCTRLCVKGGPV